VSPVPPRRLDELAITVPRLATARLVLREPRFADYERFLTNAEDPLARAHIGGPLDRRNAWRYFLAMAGAWVIHRMGWWTVEEPSLGAVGQVGVFRRELDPALEIGWSIDRPYWGRGFAPEAASAALEFALGTYGDDRVVAYVGTTNPQSCAVAEKIGMRREREVQFVDAPHWLYVAGR